MQWLNYVTVLHTYNSKFRAFLQFINYRIFHKLISYRVIRRSACVIKLKYESENDVAPDCPSK